MEAGETSAESKTQVAFVPQDLPVATVGIEVLSSACSSGEFSLEVSTNPPSSAVSPTLTISTVSDLSPTEFDEEIGHGEKQKTAKVVLRSTPEDTPATTHHDTFYFEDGNVEIACGDTIFRVHSSVISFSSPELREILSHKALVDAPTPEGQPRITVSDSVEEFAVLLKMIYTPGSVSLSVRLNHAG